MPTGNVLLHSCHTSHFFFGHSVQFACNAPNLNPCKCIFVNARLKMPSILQQRGIPMIMTRHDVLTQAKPEVAKTLTYAIPLLNVLTLPATSIHPQLLILCSNHDLCLHVQRVLLALARFMPTISCLILAEGSNATLSLGTISTTQVNVAAYGGGSNGGGKNGHLPGGYGSRNGSSADPLPVIAAHVVIGTPGKVLGLIRTKQISIAALKVMVLENADILLASPLKEATISLLSMVRDPTANNSVGAGAGSSSGAAAAAGSTSAPMISPPNSGPTSPVSMAVAALNGRIMGTNNGSTSNGSMNRFSGSYGDLETRPRSNSNAASSTPPPQSLLNSMGTTKTPPGTNQPQLLFFSTEVPAHVLDYVAQYMTQPTKALVKGHELALKGTLQFFKYLTVEDEEWRLELLCELLEDSGANRAVVFCNRDDSVSQVVRKIRERKGTAIGLVRSFIYYCVAYMCLCSLRKKKEATLTNGLLVFLVLGYGLCVTESGSGKIQVITTTSYLCVDG